MREFRVTKYNPDFRDVNGRYMLSDWIGIGGIGKKYNNKKIHLNDYLRVESKYIESVFLIMEKSGVKKLVVRDLEPRFNFFNKLRRKLPKYVYKGLDEIKYSLKEGKIISGDLIVKVVRLCLRGECWCRLEGDFNFFVHFGWDYYMYVGGDIPDVCDVEFPEGIYIEEFTSPHHREIDDE